MVTILTVICCILAVCIIYNSGTRAASMSILMAEDPSICPEDFLPVLTSGRRTVMYNGICRVLAAFVMLAYGVNAVSGVKDDLFITSSTSLAAAVGLLCLASFGSMMVIRARDFRSIRDGIMEQWKREKHVSDRHDDEVRLYKQLGEVVEIPGCNTRMVVYIACLYGLSLL